MGRTKLETIEKLKGSISIVEYVINGNPYKCGFHTQDKKLFKALLIMSSFDGHVSICDKIYLDIIGYDQKKITILFNKLRDSPHNESHSDFDDKASPQIQYP